MERTEVIEARKSAARKWLESYAEIWRNDPCVQSRERRALSVIVLTHRTSDYLAEFDPFALKECQEALTGPGLSYLGNKSPITFKE